jgi:hypothetical protein
MRGVALDGRERDRPARRAPVWAAAVLVIVAAPAASAQTPSPASPTVAGSVTGSWAAGGDLEIRVDVLAPGGWQGLHLVEAALLIGDREAERIRYDIEDAQLAIGTNQIYVGTGASASGSYLRAQGSEVVVTTGGGNLSFRMRARVLRTIPDGARFELSTTTDRGAVVSIRRGPAAPPSEGVTVGTVIAAVLGALLAGALAGNLLASRRRPPPRLSVYGAIERRLEAERAERSEAPR